MPPRLRKVSLTAHLAVSVGWVGAVAAYLALVGAAMVAQGPQTVRAAWIGMELVGWYVIVPLALASLASGIVMGLGTEWGLFRHYWVLFSLVLTLFATVVLLLHMPTVSAQAAAAVEGRSTDLPGLRGELLHAGVGLLVLLAITVLNVFKPRGMTPYGRRKRREWRGE